MMSRIASVAFCHIDDAEDSIVSGGGGSANWEMMMIRKLAHECRIVWIGSMCEARQVVVGQAPHSSITISTELLTADILVLRRTLCRANASCSPNGIPVHVWSGRLVYRTAR